MTLPSGTIYPTHILFQTSRMSVGYRPLTYFLQTSPTIAAYRSLTYFLQTRRTSVGWRLSHTLCQSFDRFVGSYTALVGGSALQAALLLWNSNRVLFEFLKVGDCPGAILFWQDGDEIFL